MDLKFLIALIIFILLFKILINITKKIIFLIFNKYGVSLSFDGLRVTQQIQWVL